MSLGAPFGVSVKLSIDLLALVFKYEVFKVAEFLKLFSVILLELFISFRCLLRNKLELSSN